MRMTEERTLLQAGPRDNAALAVASVPPRAPEQMPRCRGRLRPLDNPVFPSPARCCTARRLRDFARAALGAVALLASASAQEADSRVAAERLLYADAKAHLQSTEPEIRGEAALVLAASGDPHAYPAVLEIAQQRESEASLRGLVALGYLAVPGTAIALESAYEREGGKATPTAVCAAFALASLPGAQGDEAVTQLLSRLSEHSWKRQGDVLLAVLAALLDRGADAQRAALSRLYDDASLRDPTLRAALLTTLARIPGATSDKQLRAAIASPDPELRVAGLHALELRTELDREWLQLAEGLAQRDASASVRAAALRLLTTARHLPALDLSARALRSTDLDLVAQAVRTGQRLGGEPMRRTLERQFDYLSGSAQCVLLRELATPLTPEFAQTVRALLGATARDDELRAAAVLLLQRNGDPDLQDHLAAAFARATEPHQQLELARAYTHAVDGDPKALLAMVSIDSSTAPGRLAALLRAGSSGASRFCIERLRDPDLPPGPGAVLQALRQSRLPAFGDAARAIAPAVVRRVLEPRR